MTRRCAWCGCSLPPQPGDELEPEVVSDGICSLCGVLVLASLPTPGERPRLCLPAPPEAQ